MNESIGGQIQEMEDCQKDIDLILVKSNGDQAVFKSYKLILASRCPYFKAILLSGNKQYAQSQVYNINIYIYIYIFRSPCQNSLKQTALKFY